jgi:hypothetical protein
MTTETKDAVKILVKALKSDKDYYETWQANIAMSFYDEVRRMGLKVSRTKLHDASNQAAKNFLNLLTFEAK